MKRSFTNSADAASLYAATLHGVTLYGVTLYGVTLHALTLFVAVVLLCNQGVAQTIQTTTPINRVGGGYFEQSGIRWSLRGDQFFANFGGGAPLAPFGGAAPTSGLNSGVAFAGGGLSGSLGFNWSQGSSRSITSTSPSVTTLNGAPGSISSQTIRPFVTGITPIVGGNVYGQPATDNVSAQMAQSYQRMQATHLQQRQLAAIQARQRDAVESFQRGLRADQRGDIKTARANYRRALAKDQGPLRQQIIARMNAHRKR